VGEAIAPWLAMLWAAVDPISAAVTTIAAWVLRALVAGRRPTAAIRRTASPPRRSVPAMSHDAPPPPGPPPAGWYSDGAGERYWDGAAWTDRRRAAPQTWDAPHAPPIPLAGPAAALGSMPGAPAAPTAIGGMTRQTKLLALLVGGGIALLLLAVILVATPAVNFGLMGGNRAAGDPQQSRSGDDRQRAISTCAKSLERRISDAEVVERNVRAGLGVTHAGEDAWGVTGTWIRRDSVWKFNCSVNLDGEVIFLEADLYGQFIP
jgi:hypothetical protein